MKRPLDFGNVTWGLGLQFGGVSSCCTWEDLCYHGVCLLLTVLWLHRPRRRYAFYWVSF